MSRKILLLSVGFILIFASLGAAIFFYIKYQNTLKILKDPKESVKLESKLLVEKIGKLMELPKGEEPTVATVSDKDKLSNQPFFANAQNGDKVFIYAKGKKAILYRPSTNKIIEVGPVNIGESFQASPTAATASATKTALTKVAIYNGTKIAGLALTTEKVLKEKFPLIDVVLKENSSEDYTKTLVIDLKGNKKDVADLIAKELNGEISFFPAGEKRPEVDILIILGR